jgi:hypothetical protein
MKLSKAFMGLVLLLIAFAGVSEAQTALTQTTLSAAVNSSSNRVVVASATGVTANSTMLFIDNEALFVTGVNGTTLSVVRGQLAPRVSDTSPAPVSCSDLQMRSSRMSLQEVARTVRVCSFTLPSSTS